MINPNLNFICVSALVLLRCQKSLCGSCLYRLAQWVRAGCARKQANSFLKATTAFCRQHSLAEQSAHCRTQHTHSVAAAAVISQVSDQYPWPSTYPPACQAAACRLPQLQGSNLQLNTQTRHDGRCECACHSFRCDAPPEVPISAVMFSTACYAAVSVYLPKDRVTNNHQGYGFVEFRAEEDADYVSQQVSSRFGPAVGRAG